jgi:hypothetical protein
MWSLNTVKNSQLISLDYSDETLADAYEKIESYWQNEYGQDDSIEDDFIAVTRQAHPGNEIFLQGDKYDAKVRHREGRLDYQLEESNDLLRFLFGFEKSETYRDELLKEIPVILEDRESRNFND